jgi:hypothetical protein
MVAPLYEGSSPPCRNPITLKLSNLSAEFVQCSIPHVGVFKLVKSRRYPSHRTTDNLLRKIMVRTQPGLTRNQHHSAANYCICKYHGAMWYDVHINVSHDIPTTKCANFSYWRRMPVIYHKTHLYSVESQRDGCIAEPIKNFQTLGQFRNLFVYMWYRNSK